MLLLAGCHTQNAVLTMMPLKQLMLDHSRNSRQWDMRTSLKDESITAPVLRCLLSTTSEKCFNTFQYLSVDVLIGLLSSCSEAISMQENDIHIDTLSAVSKNLVEQLQSLIRKRNVTANILMPCTTNLFQVGILADERLEASGKSTDIKELLYLSLMHRDALRHYDKFIREGSTSAQGKKKSFVEILFQTLRNKLMSESKDDGRRYVRVMSDLFERYLISSSAVQVVMDKFGMLYKLMELCSDMKDKNLMLQCWSKLLLLCAKYEIHQQGSETSAEESKRLTQTLTTLLNKYNVFQSCGWYDCLTALLDIDYKLIEKRLDKILHTARLPFDNVNKSNPDAGTEKACSRFLCNLLKTYSKLSQIHRAVQCLASCILESSNTLTLHADVLSCLGSLITSTPASVCSDLLSTHFKQLMELIPHMKTTEECRKILSYFEIVHSIMYNMKMYDSSVATTTRDKFMGEITDMCNTIEDRIKVCGSNIEQDSSMLQALPYLFMVDSCGGVTSMINLYTQNTTSLDVKSAVELARAVGTKLPREMRALCDYLTVCIQCHVIEQSQHTRNTAEYSSDGDDVITQIIDTWTRTGEDKSKRNAVWDNKITSIRDSNIRMAIFMRLSQSTVPLLMSVSDSNELLQRFVEQLVNLSMDLSSQGRDSSMTELVKYLQCWRCTESSRLHRAIIKHVLRILSQSFDQASSSMVKSAKKKRKKSSSSGEDSLINYLSYVTERLTSLESTDKTVGYEQLYAHTNAILNEAASSVNTQQTLCLDVSGTLLSCIPITNRLGAGYLSVLSSVSMVLLKLLVGKYESDEGGDVTTSDSSVTCDSPVLTVLLTSLQYQSKEIWSHVDIEALIGLLDRVHARARHDMNTSQGDVILDWIIRALTADADVFSKANTFLGQCCEEFLSEQKNAQSERSEVKDLCSRRLLLLFVTSISQIKDNKTCKSQRQWLQSYTKKLVTALKRSVQAGSSVSQHVMVWISWVIDQCDDVTDVITKSAIDHLHRAAMSDSKISKGMIESSLTYLTAWCGSKSHNADVYDGITLWSDLVQLADSDVCMTKLEKMIHSFTSAVTTEMLETFILSLHQNIETNGTSQLSSVITMWRILLSQHASLEKKKQTVVESGCKQLMDESHSCLCELGGVMRSHDTSDNIVSPQATLVSLLSLITDILGKGKVFSDSQHVTAILAGMQMIDIKSSSTVHDLLLPISAIQKLLRTLLLHHETSAGYSAAQITNTASNITRAVIVCGSQSNIQQEVDKGAELVKLENNMLSCCQELNKMYSLMAEYPKMFSKLAGFMMADVMSYLQSVTLLPSVKKALHLALNGLFDLTDEYSVVMLKTNLPEAQREMFKTVEQRYQKYHKYTGKV